MHPRLAPAFILLLSAGLHACLPDLEEDTAACSGPELCNGEDDDCDGSVDENATDAPAWYPDADGDGYGDPTTSTISCEQPTGFVAEDKATGESADCDDGDDDIFPGADDTWYDGVDSDCAGDSDYDQDGDGHDHDAFGGDDCDDADADAYPGQSEVWYDGVDQDCDGASDYDQDGDDHDSWEHGGDDCDDLASDVHPGAPEIWYDGVDNDCDGRSDYDQDYDGHDSDAYGGTDCDDLDESIQPGADDAWYDGIDSDCAGNDDYDQDGDGWSYTGATGDDCDDEDVAVHPMALEWIDSLDNNCDSDIDELTLDNAAVVLEGIAGSDSAGCAVAGVGDVNNDGYDDVLIGAYGNNDGARDGGAAYLLYGPVSSGNLSTADATLQGWLAGGLAGYSVAGAGDVNADGYADLLIGVPWEGSEASDDSYTGAAYLIHGPVSGEMSLADAELIMRAVSYDDGAGWYVSGGVDATGDGSPDLLVGATDISTVVQYGGGAYLVDGSDTGEIGLNEALATLLGSQAYAYAGSSVSLVDDMDGDGIGEVLVGVPSYDDSNGVGTSFPDVGIAYIHNGPVSGTIDLAADADGILNGENSGDRLGECVAGVGDVTDDGLGDILVGAPAAGNGASEGPGKVYLVQGPFSGEDYLYYISTAIFEGPADDNGASFCTVAQAGDMDHDARGIPDILLGAYAHDSNGSDAGSAFLYLAPFGGTIGTDDAAAVFTGAAAGDEAGYSVSGAGDTNADGYPDLLIGAPYANTTGTDAGAAYLLLGSPLP